MKLRMYKNSLRFRFDRDEVARLNDGERLESSIQLGPGADHTFTYCVAPGLDAPGEMAVRTRLEQRSLTATVSRDALKRWCEGEDLALTAEESWDGCVLKVLLEKDMQRLNPKPGEETANVYPNPKFGKQRCDHP
jgi:hypothetical protein